VLARYFAYGSNLHPEHMRRRVSSAAAIGPALLRGMRLTLDKHGRDGSGKANLTEDRASGVWGVIYTIEHSHWAVLDAIEAGYQRIRVSVEHTGKALGVETYASTLRTSKPIAFDWYKRLIVDGARAHGLPETWVAQLELLPARAAPR
jgi:gamma-glutamylcyclotransferase (GGCT)/AIG2-like uncharacterized protein YtfP